MLINSLDLFYLIKLFFLYILIFSYNFLIRKFKKEEYSFSITYPTKRNTIPKAIKKVFVQKSKEAIASLSLARLKTISLLIDLLHFQA